MSDMAQLAAAVWRIAFLTASAPVIGSVLLLAIGQVTGASWRALTPLAAAAPWLMPGAALLGVAQLMIPAPAHLHLWLAWWAVLPRGLLATAALAFASARLRAGAGSTFAAITLAVYAVIVTPLAFDWMLGQSPGHAASAAGMMQLTQGIGSAAALALALQLGTPAFRRDMARLMVAAVLGLAYLGYMDFLIVWYGNLPAHVGFYLTRTMGVMALPVWSGLVVGVAAPILLLWLMPQDRGLQAAGACALLGMALLDAWWVSGGLAAALGGLVGGGLLLTLVALGISGEPSHG